MDFLKDDLFNQFIELNKAYDIECTNCKLKFTTNKLYQNCPICEKLNAPAWVVEVDKQMKVTRELGYQICDAIINYLSTIAKEIKDFEGAEMFLSRANAFKELKEQWQNSKIQLFLYDFETIATCAKKSLEVQAEMEEFLKKEEKKKGEKA